MSQFAGSLDTNIILRLLLNDVPEQHQRAAKLVQSSKAQLAVADLAITEVVFALGRAYGFSRQQIAEAVQGIMGLQSINCNRSLFQKVLPLYIDNPALSFEDCCLAVYAELNNAEPLFTFDKKLANQSSVAQLV